MKSWPTYKNPVVFQVDADAGSLSFGSAIMRHEDDGVVDRLRRTLRTLQVIYWRFFWTEFLKRYCAYILFVAHRKKERNTTCLCESVRTLLLFSLFTKILIRSFLSRIVRVLDRFWSHRRRFCTRFIRCPMLIVRLRERDAFASKMRLFSILFPVLWTWTKSTVCQRRNVLHRVAFAQSLSFSSLRQPKQLNSSVGCERHRSYAIREENGWYRGVYHLLHACT